MAQRFSTDVLIIGGGAAGLAAALNLADAMRVTVLCKGDMTSGSSHWAQGGIASVTDPEDTFDDHTRDTVVAGAGLCDERIVRTVVEAGPHVVETLSNWGVQFDRRDNEYHLTREGGHSLRRVLHVADATGKAMIETLTTRVLDHPNIELFNDRVAIDLINLSKLGRYPEPLRRRVRSQPHGWTRPRSSNHSSSFSPRAAPARFTSTPPTPTAPPATGSPWLGGRDVGSRTWNFNQFHPTCLYHPHAGSFLISEAVRGEGGVLRLEDGEAFMQRFDERGDLAPRDIVARAIDHEMKRLGADCVYLDITHRPHEFVLSHFPTIAERCRELGIDITKEPIPGGSCPHTTRAEAFWSDSRGRSDLPHLYAIGEVSYTGMHGCEPLGVQLLVGMPGVRATGRRQDQGPIRSRSRLAKRSPLGRVPSHRLGRIHRHLTQLGRAQAVHVGLRRHRQNRQTIAARAAPHRPTEARDQRLLCELSDHQRSDRAAQTSCTLRISSYDPRSSAPKAAVCTSTWTIPKQRAPRATPSCSRARSITSICSNPPADDRDAASQSAAAPRSPRAKPRRQRPIAISVRET